MSAFPQLFAGTIPFNAMALRLPSSSVTQRHTQRSADTHTDKYATAGHVNLNNSRALRIRLFSKTQGLRTQNWYMAENVSGAWISKASQQSRSVIADG
jgi:hypothetical protein